MFGFHLTLCKSIYNLVIIHILVYRREVQTLTQGRSLSSSSRFPDYDILEGMGQVGIEKMMYGKASKQTNNKNKTQTNKKLSSLKWRPQRLETEF